MNKTMIWVNILFLIGFLSGLLLGYIIFQTYITNYTNNCINEYNNCVNMYNDCISVNDPSIPLLFNYSVEYISEEGDID